MVPPIAAEIFTSFAFKSRFSLTLGVRVATSTETPTVPSVRLRETPLEAVVLTSFTLRFAVRFSTFVEIVSTDSFVASAETSAVTLSTPASESSSATPLEAVLSTDFTS